MSTRLHAEHIWQMSATGWCFCYGLETTPVFDALERKYNSELSMYQFMGGALRIISDSS